MVTSSPLKYSYKINCPKGQLLSTSNDKLFKPVCDNKGNFGQKKYPRLHVQESSENFSPAENFKEKPALFSLVKLEGLGEQFTSKEKTTAMVLVMKRSRGCN